MNGGQRDFGPRALVDRVGRVDRHIAELRDDLKLMIRSELMGQLRQPASVRCMAQAADRLNGILNSKLSSFRTYRW